MNEKNTGLIAALIIFIIISLGLGGFIYYNNIMSNKNEGSDIKKLANDIIETATEKEQYQVLQLTPIEGLAVVYKGEVYINIYADNPTITKIYGNEKILQEETRKTYKEYDFGNLKVTTEFLNDGNSNKWLKLNASNIKVINNNEYGQAYYEHENSKYGIAMLTNGGEVLFSKTKDLMNGKIDPIKLNVSNVSNIEIEATSAGYVTYLIKADGTKININTLIE